MRRVLPVLSFALVLVVLVALSGCKRAAKAPAGPTIRVFVDDVEVGVVAVSEEPIPLASRLPKEAADPETWRRIEAHASGGRFLDVRRPTETYANGEVRLYLQQKQPAIGVFRPVREGLPEHIAKIARQPAVSLSDVSKVVVHTRDPVPVPVAELSLEATGLPPWTIVPEDLEDLPVVAGDRSAGRGRAVRDVVRARTQGLVDRVVIEARDGRAHTLDAEDLADEGKKALLRVNRKNQWVFKLYEGGADSASAEVRDVVRLRIEGTDLRGRGRGGDGSGTGDGSGARRAEQNGPAAH